MIQFIIALTHGFISIFTSLSPPSILSATQRKKGFKFNFLSSAPSAVLGMQHVLKSSQENALGLENSF